VPELKDLFAEKQRMLVNARKLKDASMLPRELNVNTAVNPEILDVIKYVFA
jgi:hypothetical protein